MYVVSDDVLERLICSQCKKYLSVKTIKVYPNRGIKCGRCSHAEDAGVVSLFGVLAEEALFRCINRFDGCNQLLSYSDVAEHEKSCIGKEHECPCCVQPFTGTAYEINIHFKELHPERLLVHNPEFILEIENEQARNYLYCKNDMLFYINARYNRGEDELILNAVYLGTDQDASKITQMFTLHSLDGKMKYKTKRKSCSSLIGGNIKCFRINLSSADYPKNIIVCRFNLNTEYVENLVALPKTLKKSKQDVGKTCNIITKSNNIIKPSVFEKNTYPVTVFNPTAPVFSPTITTTFNPTAPVFINPSGSTWGLKSGDIPASARVSSQPNTTTTSTSIFGNSNSTTVANVNATNSKPMSTSSPDFSIFDPLRTTNQPVTTTTNSTSIFGKSTVTSSFTGKPVPTTSATSFSFGKPVTTTSNSQNHMLTNSFNFSVKPSIGGLFQSNTQGQEADKNKGLFGFSKKS